MDDASKRRIALDSMEVDTAGVEAQLAAVLSYDGAPFAGFARQPGRHTVQGDLERAFSMALRRPVELVCAGRTDAGVHARAQVVSFPIGRGELEGRALARLRRSVQALTDDAIVMQTLAVMPPEFSARFSAIEREYRYLLVPGERHPLFLRQWCWDVRRDLDVGAMNEAAALLVGEHDFKSFCMAASAEGRNTVRELREVSVVPVSVLGEDALSVRVVGTAFLHSMVRSIVGTLVAVGAGRHDPSWVGEVLEARDRRAAGENAPARGLVFWRVSYRGGLPCYERDYPGEPSSKRGFADAAPGVAPQDVALAEAVIGALEARGEDGDDAAFPTAAASNQPFSEAVLSGSLPRAVVEAASRPGSGGRVVRNEAPGPAVPAAPRTRRIAPADPRPADGEVSLSFDVPRESAAARAAKGGEARKKGLFGNLFGKSGNDRA